MIFALILGILIPLLFWLFDTLIKVYGSIPVDDIGADLCLFAVSFNITTIFISSVSSSLGEIGEGYATIAALALIVSLILYVFTLTIIAPGKRKKYPSLIQKLRINPNRVFITVVIGFTIVFTQTMIYVLSF
jgi:glucan phosphoethanolaminetransferase (alkaline phosphatase superfamily)